MGYDWEFDGSVDFAPPRYRQEKYEECKKLGAQIKDEKTALKFLKKFDYVKYLAIDCHHANEISNWEDLCNQYGKALLHLKSDKQKFIHITYPLQHRKWRTMFDYLRSKERDVLHKRYDMDKYMEEITTFNSILRDINTTCHKYNIIGHTLYWVQSGLLKNQIKKKLNKDDDLELNGV